MRLAAVAQVPSLWADLADDFHSNGTFFGFAHSLD